MYVLTRVNRSDPFYIKYNIPHDPRALFFSASLVANSPPKLICGFRFRGSLQEILASSKNPEIYAVKLDPVDKIDSLSLNLQYLERYVSFHGQLPPDGTKFRRC